MFKTKIFSIIVITMVILFSMPSCVNNLAPSFSIVDTEELSAPHNFIIEWSILRWTSDSRAETSKVSIKRATSDEFEEISFVVASNHGWAGGLTDGISLRELNLEVGHNIIEVISFGDSSWNNGVTTYGIHSKEANYTITIDTIIEEQVAPPEDPWFEIWGNEIQTGWGVIVYIKHPGENEFIHINGSESHGRFFGELPELRIGESTIKLIRRGAWDRLDGNTLIIATDSEPVFLPLINNLEDRQIPAPTDLRITGSGPSAALSWNCNNSNCFTGCSVSTRTSGDFAHGTQGYNNSVPLNRLNFVLGNNEIMVTTQGKTIIEDNNIITYEPGKTIMQFTVHQERQLLPPTNFRIEPFGSNNRLTWDRDPMAHGNSISDNFTTIEIKQPGQEEFKRLPFSGVMHGVELFMLSNPNYDSSLRFGENIVRIRIATGNLSIIDGVVTKYTQSDYGYVVLFMDAEGVYNEELGTRN